MRCRQAQIAALTVVLAGLLGGPPGQALPDTKPTPVSPAPPGAHRLTAESFDRLLKAEAKLNPLVQRDRRLELSIASSTDPDLIRQWRHRIDSDSQTRETLRGMGLTTDTYFSTLLAVLQAAAVRDFKDAGKPVPDALAAKVPAENVAFANAHAAQIASMLRQKSGKAAVGPNTFEDLYAPPPDAAAAPAGAETASAGSDPKPAGETPAAEASSPKKKDAKKPSADEPAKPPVPPGR